MSLLNLFKRHQEIWKNGKLYLRRTYILPKTKKLKIHEILQSDVDRDLHDHPWNFTSIMLRGGYDEERMDDKGNVRTERHTAPCILHRKGTDLHRLTLHDGKPVLTLVWTSGKFREWGFQTPSGWVHWEEYLNAGETVDTKYI